MNPPPETALFLGRFHPLLVHLPIGFILLLALLELLSRSRRFRQANLNAGYMLWLCVPASAVAAVCGWLLSLGGGYEDGLLQWHKWTGIAAAAACALAGLLYWLDLKKLYRVCLFGSVAALAVASHYGGSLTHGKGYLARYAPAALRGWLGGESAAPAAEKKPVAAGEQQAFHDVVKPVFDQYCVGCHGPQKAKAQLRLDSLAAVLKGSEHGAVIVAGKSAESPLVSRLRLPPESEDHMPPDGKPQPSAEEIALLAWWIDSGTPDTQKIADLKVPANIRRILDGRSGSPTPVARTDPPKPLLEVLPLTEKLADELNVALTPLSQTEPWLQCNASIAGTNFGDADLAKLAPLAANLRWLDLAGTRVTDAGLAPLAAMSHLTRLHLERTGVTDTGLAPLAGLTELEYLNLYGTGVTDAGLETLKALPKLRQLYLWQTKVTAPAAKAFADARVDKQQIQTWQNEIEQLRSRIRGQQVSLNLGVTSAAPPATNAAAVNTQCPVSDKPVDPAQTVLYEGSVVAFCCEKCKAAFEKDPKPYLAKLNLRGKPAVAAADAKPINTKCPVSGKEIDPTKTVVHAGKLVAFCCDDCKAKFEKDPQVFLAKLDLNPPKTDPPKKN